jgi:hypothetical protein
MEAHTAPIIPDVTPLRDPPVVPPPLTEVEQPTTLSVPPKRTLHLRGRVVRAGRGRQDLALSEEEIAGLPLGDGHE